MALVKTQSILHRFLPYKDGTPSARRAVSVAR
jgi:hypothetical protein